MRVISIPLSEAAMQRLDLDQCAEGDLHEITLTDADTDSLFNSGLIDALNTALGTLIDRYEDTALQTDAQLQTALAILRQTCPPAASPLARQLETAIELAINRRTGVFFYL